jgi:hypothetical protein
LIWTRDYKWPNGNTTRSVTSTVGAAIDLKSEDLRRLFVNACFWLTGVQTPPKADVGLVGEYNPSFFGFNGYKKGIKPEAHELH